MLSLKCLSYQVKKWNRQLNIHESGHQGKGPDQINKFWSQKMSEQMCQLLLTDWIKYGLRINTGFVNIKFVRTYWSRFRKEWEAKKWKPCFSRVFVKGGRKMGWLILLPIILKPFSITFNIIQLEGIATRYLGCRAY